MLKLPFRCLRAVLLAALTVGAVQTAAQVPSPEHFLGVKPGEDRTLIDWQAVVAYFDQLQQKSDRVRVDQIGRTTLGRPLILATISDPFNLLNLAKFRNLQRQAANPRRLTDGDARLLARRNKAVVLVAMNVEARDPLSSQAALELAHFLATDDSEATAQILKNVIVLLLPSANPDGLEAVVDWYNTHLGTAAEGSWPPYLTHPYAGTEHCLDWLGTNFPESRAVARQLYQVWFPHVVYANRAGEVGASRLTFPNSEFSGASSGRHLLVAKPLRALIQSVADRLREQGFAGAASREVGIGGGGSDLTAGARWHNMLAWSAEVAGVQVATPLFFPRGSGMASRPNGWWRPRDVLRYQLGVVTALLSRVAAEKEAIIYTFCQRNLETVRRRPDALPFAFVMPRKQHDPAAARRLVQTLERAGLEVQRATADFVAGSHRFAAGSYVVLGAQPFAPLLTRLFLPSRFERRTRPPSGDAELTTWNLPLMMGVHTVAVAQAFQAPLLPAGRALPDSGRLMGKGGKGYLISARDTRSFALANELVKKRRKVFRLKSDVRLPEETYAPGAFYVSAGEVRWKEMHRLVQRFGMSARQTEHDFSGAPVYRLKPVRLGLYQPFTANADEGWTRWVLEEFNFDHKVLHNPSVRRGGLKNEYDVILLPDMTGEEILSGQDGRSWFEPQLPESYRGGIGEKGVRNLERFVLDGGVLIALDSSCDFLIDQFGLPVENVLRDLPRETFACPGALLKVRVDFSHALGYGMPSEAAVLFADSPAFRPLPWRRPTQVPVYYPGSEVLLSGSAHGEEKLRGRAALVEIPMGKGRVILFGFRPQFRALTFGTFKLLFNAIFLATAEEEEL